MNLLHLENSPYLLQHANNPVHWMPYNQAALNLAQNDNKLLLVSIGYAACHWCHVMEHDCFESEEVANVQNQFFINIKVDREERPDIDALYMKSLQMMNGQGGWPLNMVCLPDGRPIWGATYVRKDDWIKVLTQLHDLYANQPEKVISYANSLEDGLLTTQLALSETKHHNLPWEKWMTNWAKSCDTTYGGYSRAPKFMMPTNLEFLSVFVQTTQDTFFKKHLETTLCRMAWGGLFDVVDGGFSRYAVDVKWHVPHFEKMLYDNALLLSVYAKNYITTKNPLYKSVIKKTIDFMTNHWLTPEGLFYASWDADSYNERGDLEEGAFYVWTKDELKALLQDDFEAFAVVYNINDFGYWEHNHYVLIQQEDDESLSNRLGWTPKTLAEKQTAWLSILKNHRSQRPQPRLDDKLITSWNAMAAVGLLDAYLALGDEAYLTLAKKNLQFLRHQLWHGEQLFRIYKNKQTFIPAFLEDYAFLIQALIKWFQIEADPEVLNFAKMLTNQVLDLFYDANKQFFKFQQNAANQWQTHFDIEDNVIPSSNAIMAQNLRLLGLLYFNEYYSKVSQTMTQKVVEQIDYPTAYSHWLIEQWHLEHPPKELIIIGSNAKTHFDYFQKKHLHKLIVFYSATPLDIPLFNRPTTNQTLFYLCANGSCLAPESSVNSVEKALGF